MNSNVNLNIYLIYKTDITSYEQYDSLLVVAPDTVSAIKLHPLKDDIYSDIVKNPKSFGGSCYLEESSWDSKNNYAIKCIGKANDSFKTSQIIIGSFNRA